MILRPKAGRARTHLVGRNVLLVEDDFFMARDLQQALQHAGARVLGPCAESPSALHMISQETISCAIVDLDLRDRGGFNLASALVAKNIPFFFLSGFSEVVSMNEYGNVPLLHTPVELDALLGMTARLLGYPENKASEAHDVSTTDRAGFG